ncbi:MULTISPECIES: hypothetical protein [unclassified Streptomyces]|uniref:hypothetical protein n=1 Tax=unclassified Streptomyces TaxID=2593676 RepID=UPI00344576C1
MVITRHDHGAPSAAAGTVSGTFRARLPWTIAISATITLVQVVGDHFDLAHSTRRPEPEGHAEDERALHT